MNGSFLAPVIVVAYCILREIEGYLLFRLGYKTGKTSFMKLMKSGLIDEVLTGANILGMFMVGALSSSMVSVSSTLEAGDFVLQNTLDSFLPGILPLATVFGIYYLITKKKMSSAKVVLLVIAIGIVGSLIGLF